MVDVHRYHINIVGKLIRSFMKVATLDYYGMGVSILFKQSATTKLKIKKFQFMKKKKKIKKIKEFQLYFFFFKN